MSNIPEMIETIQSLRSQLASRDAELEQAHALVYRMNTLEEKMVSEHQSTMLTLAARDAEIAALRTDNAKLWERIESHDETAKEITDDLVYKTSEIRALKAKCERYQKALEEISNKHSLASAGIVWLIAREALKEPEGEKG